MRKAIFSYSLNRKEAMRKQYPKSIANIHDALIKIPASQKKLSPPSSPMKIFPQSNTEEKEEKSQLSIALDSITFSRP